jgi:molybdenum cofactor guanylyltransferase
MSTQTGAPRNAGDAAAQGGNAAKDHESAAGRSMDAVPAAPDSTQRKPPAKRNTVQDPKPPIRDSVAHGQVASPDDAALSAPAEPMRITGLILAGGRGSRMGNADKGCVLLHGQPMVEHVAARFAPQVCSLLISANRNLERYSEYGKVVSDDPAHGDWQGPLAGVAAGMLAARCPWVATAPCDSPFLPHDLVARLRHALQTQAGGARLAVATSNGRRHAVCMLLSRELLPDLLRYFAGGGRRVYAWQQQVGCLEVAFDDQPDAFVNVNTEGELADVGRHEMG